MYTSNLRLFIPPTFLLCFLSVVALLTNYFTYNYPGNNYFPLQTSYVALALFLMYSGFVLQFGRNNQLTKMMKEVICFFLVMSVLALATNAAQFTPFPPIDSKILAFETSLHINIKAIITWTNSKPFFKETLGFIYDTLPYQMCYFPLILIALKQFDCIREHYFLLIVSALIGFTFYYFFPTMAPASVIDSQYFTEVQRATGLKFMQLHQHIQPTTIDGGMIALPSFHVIWAWFCLYLLRHVYVVFVVMLPINLFLIVSCVLLGWHYPIDILGAVMVILMTHWAHFYYKKRTSLSRKSLILVHHNGTYGQHMNHDEQKPSPFLPR